MSKGLWVLPSRRRPEALKDLFAVLAATGCNTGGLILIEKNEMEKLKDIYLTLKLPDKWTWYTTDSEGYAAKCNEFVHDPIARDLDWIGFLADDLCPETYQWDARLISRMNGYNVVAANDGYQAPKRMNGAIVFSRPLLDAVGYFAPPGMQHLFDT